MHELILGGQRSGKSRCAETRAATWLAADPAHEAVLIATARAGDAEMAERIAQHRQERAARLPRWVADEVPIALPQAIARHADARRLVVVDCLTLWLTNLLMPADGAGVGLERCRAMVDALGVVLARVQSPVVLVSNEIGLGVAPVSAEARQYVDELGRLHQRLAARCGRVTLMVAGLEVAVKREVRE
jgi:adenosylcobinamide kinase/adenosylcobinamide-phosphate guanylyltransferase